MKKALLFSLFISPILFVIFSNAMQQSPSNKNHSALSLMGYSAINGLDGVKRCIAEGADVNAEEGYCHFTPLYYAVRNDHIDIVRYLVEHGADIHKKMFDQRDNDVPKIMPNYGTTALAVASTNNRYAIVAYLAQRVNDINAVDQDGKSALIHALQRRNTIAALILIAHGATESAKQFLRINSTEHCHLLNDQELNNARTILDLCAQFDEYVQRKDHEGAIQFLSTIQNSKPKEELLHAALIFRTYPNKPLFLKLWEKESVQKLLTKNAMTLGFTEEIQWMLL